MHNTNPSSVNRRAFIKTASALAGAAAVSSGLPSLPAAATPERRTMSRRKLGRTGLEVTVMTLGAAPFGIADDVSVEEGVEIVNTALEMGITSIDTAPKYGKSEEVVGKALGARRKEIVLATKVWADDLKEAEASLAGSFKKLKTDFFDILYFHHLGDRKVDVARDPEGVFTWLLKQKQAGKCRFVGLSGHNLPARFLPFIESGDVDVILVALNFVDRFTYNFEEKVLPAARRHQVGIVAMKVFGGPDGKTGSWGTRKAKPTIGEKNLPLAIRYALSLPDVATANLGVHTVEQLRQNIAWVYEFRSLSGEEREQADQMGRELAPQWGPHFGPVS